MFNYGKVFTGVLLMLFVGCLANAQETKIVYVDGQRIVNESIAGKDAIKRLKSIKVDKQAEIDRREEDLKRLREDLSVKSPAMSEDAKNKQEMEYQRKMKELNRFIKDAQDDLHARYKELIDPISKDLDDIINSYGKKHNIGLILDRRQSGIVYASDRIDITDKIIGLYNKAYKQRSKKN